MMFSNAARIAALMIGTSVLATASPAAAQRAPRGNQQQAQPAAPAQPPQRQFNLSRAERAAIQPLVAASQAALSAQAAGQTPNWASVQALLPAAQAAARGNDARYLVSKAQYLLARASNSVEQQEQVLSVIAVNPATPAAEVAETRQELSRLKNLRAERAFAASDFATAERIYLELQRETPNDQRVTNNLAIVRGRMGNTVGAAETLLQQISTAEANGGRASEDLYRRVRDRFYTARDAPRAQEFAIKLARNYPTGRNWRDAIVMQREFGRPPAELALAGYRLQRAANALEGEGDYVSYAELLRSGGYPGEAKAVAEAGIAAGAFTRQRQGVPELMRWADENVARDRAGLDREARDARAGTDARVALRVGDALYGYGRYTEAADLYRVALTKPGANRDQINLHLGAALAMANQRAEAEAAFRAVSGTSASLASLWLAWLGRSQG